VFGDEILHYMDKIYNMCDKNDREALKNISKFFGYLYWKVCAIESEKKRSKENNQSLLQGEEKDVDG